MGVKEHPLYKRWRFIQDVTRNPNDANYQNYGGAHGVECHFKDFDEFRKYIERRLGLPQYPLTQLHRKKGQGHFAPGNLEWATKTQVARHHKGNKFITYKGKTRCLSEWADHYQMSYGLAVERCKYGWTFEEAMGIKPRQRKKKIL
jgi:hypothetical protein